MDLLLIIIKSLTFGAIIGLIVGIVKRRKSSDDENNDRAERTSRLFKIISPYINTITFVVLFIGLIWTTYFMILGIINSSQTEYATNVSQLIVSVLTVFSIIIAFSEFLRK